MADSGAVRVKRSRAHAKDDHSLCIPGRCPALDEPEQAPPDGLGPSGQWLYDEVSARADLSATTRVMLTEAARIVDRLDRLDAQLHGREWLRFRANPDREGHVTVHIDRALSEAREQATALRGLLTDIDKAVRSNSDAPTALPTEVADLAARIRQKMSRQSG